MPIVDARDTALKMIENPESYTPNQIVFLLRSADNAYSNDGESIIDDNIYDALRLIAQRLSPTDEYFLGVGSNVRGGKVKLPFEMGSLDQVEIGDIESWITKNNLQEEEIVLTDKMDGTSALIVYNDKGESQIAYSRGNGTEGADISRHIFKIKNVPTQLPSKTSLVVRAEVELTEPAFLKLREMIKSSSGKKYKNARNMVAGIMNSSDRPDFVYEYLTVITYQIVGDETISKSQMLARLGDEGFQVAPFWRFLGKELNDEMLASYLQDRKSITDYAIDGLVLDVNSISKRQEMNPTKDTLNPAYSIKYKVADADNTAIATVRYVEWNTSKHNFLKPRVVIEPVDLVGVTIQHLTGFNARFIKDNGIGPGAKLRITRSGDVIPFIQECVEPTKADLPPGFESIWNWNETEVDAVLLEQSTEADLQQIVDFFMSIEAPHLKEGTVRKFYAMGFQTIESIIKMDANEMVTIIGMNGAKIFNGLKEKFSNMPLNVLAGSTTIFGRGVGKRKFKKLIEGLKIKSINEFPLLNVSQICTVEGFEETTAKKIIGGMDEFMAFADELKDYINIADSTVVEGGKLSNEKIAFTGFRNVEWQATVEQQGGTMQSAVSGKTTILVAKNPTSTSGKMKKARDNGTTIMGLDEFEAFLNG